MDSVEWKTKIQFNFRCNLWTRNSPNVKNSCSGRILEKVWNECGWTCSNGRTLLIRDNRKSKRLTKLPSVFLMLLLCGHCHLQKFRMYVVHSYALCWIINGFFLVSDALGSHNEIEKWFKTNFNFQKFISFQNNCQWWW